MQLLKTDWKEFLRCNYPELDSIDIKRDEENYKQENF
jgi:hypothetical protein